MVKMDVQKITLYTFLFIILIRTFVRTKPVVELQDLERLENEVESELDNIVTILQDVRTMKYNLRRSRRHSDQELEEDGGPFVRRRRTHPRNRYTFVSFQCKRARLRGEWPAFCETFFRGSQSGDTQVIDATNE